MSGKALEAQETLPAHPSSVSTARRWVAEWLIRTGHAELVEDARIAISELATNALVHAGTGFELTALFEAGVLRIEVADGSARLPHRRDYAVTAGTGRGLKLLGETVTRWGAQRRGPGKVVWFELSRVGAPGDVREVVRDEPPSESAVRVDLLNVPLLLHSAWHEAAEALLREHLLVRLDDGDTGWSFDLHAAASDAMTLLAAQVPTPELDQDPEALMAAATEPLVSSDRVELHVPKESIGHFAVLDDIMDDATRLADEGLLLTPPTQPEVRELRRWLCHQVLHQATGGAAQPWVTASESLTAPQATPIIWSFQQVDDAVIACIAADDTDLIVAVSVSALGMLGYADRSDLVGRRLLSIIPARYHQAHLAGFTMHLSTGRRPLLDRPVRVPVLLGDGTERLTELTVTSERLPEGRSVFVAEMRPIALA